MQLHTQELIVHAHLQSIFPHVDWSNSRVDPATDFATTTSDEIPQFVTTHVRSRTASGAAAITYANLHGPFCAILCWFIVFLLRSNSVFCKLWARVVLLYSKHTTGRICLFCFFHLPTSFNEFIYFICRHRLICFNRLRYCGYIRQ